MTYLVCDHALQLISVQPTQKPRGYRYGGGFRVSAGCKGIGSSVGYDIDLRHRHRGGDRHLFDNVE